MSNRIRLVGVLCAIAVLVAAYFLVTGVAYGVAALGSRYCLTLSDPRAMAWLLGIPYAIGTLMGLVVFAHYVGRCRRALREGTAMTKKEFQQRFGSAHFVILMLMPMYVPMIARGGHLMSTLVATGFAASVTMAAFLVAAFFQQRVSRRLVEPDSGHIRVKFTRADWRASVTMAGTIALALFAMVCAGDNVSRQWLYAGLAIVVGGVLFAWSLRTRKLAVSLPIAKR